jgi:chromosomal replication initiator protein
MSPYRIHDIERTVCRRFRLTVEELRGPSRCRRIARPRQIAMYLARVLAGASYPKIAGHFGGRDHATAIHASRKIAAMAKEGGRMHAYLNELKTMLDTASSSEAVGENKERGESYERQAQAAAKNDGGGAGDHRP